MWLFFPNHLLAYCTDCLLILCFLTHLKALFGWEEIIGLCVCLDADDFQTCFYLVLSCAICDYTNICEYQHSVGRFRLIVSVVIRSVPFSAYERCSRIRTQMDPGFVV